MLVVVAAIIAGAGVAAIATNSSGPPAENRVTAPPSPGASPADGDDGRRGADAASVATRLETLRAGRGARGAEVIRPAGADRLPGVIFLHGWGLVARSDYRPWIRHLARAGNQVIVPRYQRDEDSDPGRALSDAVAGIRAALRKAPVAEGSLVVAGHSAGGALAADYAASATARGLPTVLAVFSVYPGRRILGYPLGIPEVDPVRIPARTHIVALAGAGDIVVGQAPAQELVTDAQRVPANRKRYQLIRREAVSGHYGPTRSGPVARRVFWGRLDRLIERAR